MRTESSLKSWSQDERSRSLPTFRIVEATYKEQIISASLKAEFAKHLPAHVTEFSEYSILDRAIVMNNMLAASKVRIATLVAPNISICVDACVRGRACPRESEGVRVFECGPN
jgi:hypothetical protein